MIYSKRYWLILMLNTQSALGNFHQSLNLTKEDFWSTLKQPYPSDEEINRTQEN